MDSIEHGIKDGVDQGTWRYHTAHAVQKHLSSVRKIVIVVNYDIQVSAKRKVASRGRFTFSEAE